MFSPIMGEVEGINEIMQDVAILIGGQKLAGRLFRPKKTFGLSPAVLFIHGYGRKTGKDRFFYAAEELSSIGFVCLVFDMRGYGESEGDIDKISIRENLRDVLASYDFLAEQEGVDKDKISVIGSSYGAYLACLLSSKRRVESLALRVPAPFRDEDFDFPIVEGDLKRREYRSELHEYKNDMGLRALHGFGGRVLIIESEKDEQIPHASIESFLDAVSDKSKIAHKVMKDATHSLVTVKMKKELVEILREWFSQLA